MTLCGINSYRAYSSNHRKHKGLPRCRPPGQLINYISDPLPNQTAVFFDKRTAFFLSTSFASALFPSITIFLVSTDRCYPVPGENHVPFILFTNFDINPQFTTRPSIYQARAPPCLLLFFPLQRQEDTNALCT